MAQENYNTFDFTPYESNFAEGRREELADRTRKEFDTNKAEYDILKRTIGALEVTDANKYHIDQMNADIDKTMQGVLETGRYDLASFAVSDSLTRFMTDNVVKNAVEGFQTRKKEKQLIAANPDKFHDYNIVPARVDLDTSQKLTAAEYNDPAKMQNSRVMYDPTTQAVEYIDLSEGHDAKDGAYLGNSEEIKSHQAKAYEMMKSIATDPTHYKYVKAVANAYGVTDDIAKKFIMSGKAVTEGKVQGLAEELLQMYSDTPEGLQRARDLARKVSSNVEELSIPATGMSPGMSIPVMNTNSPEEIQAALLNDLVTAGQTQIGVTQNLTNIPQDRVSTTSKTSDTEGLIYKDYTVGDQLNLMNETHAEQIKNANSGAAGPYKSDGSFNTEESEVLGTSTIDRKKRTALLKGQTALLRAKEHLATVQVVDPLTGGVMSSTNPLDIKDEYERIAYILDTTKDIRPPGITDMQHVQAYEKRLRQETHAVVSSKGIPPGKRDEAANFVLQDINKGKLYSPGIRGGQAVTLNQMSADLADGFLWNSKSDLVKYQNQILDALEVAKGGTSKLEKNPISVVVKGASLDPKYPGAFMLEVTNTSVTGPEASQTIYFEGAANPRNTLTPAAYLVGVRNGTYRGLEVPYPFEYPDGNIRYLKEDLAAVKDKKGNIIKDADGNIKYESVVELIIKQPDKVEVSRTTLTKSEHAQYFDLADKRIWDQYRNGNTPSANLFRSDIDSKDAYDAGK